MLYIDNNYLGIIYAFVRNVQENCYFIAYFDFENMYPSKRCNVVWFLDMKENEEYKEQNNKLELK
jgi:hypothetical protein